MRRYSNMIAVCTLATLVAASSVAAQSIGVAGGVVRPSGDYGKAMNSGYNVTGMLSLDAMLLPIGLRADVAYNHFALNQSMTSGITGNSTIFGGALNAVVHLPGLVVSPYLVGGPGMYRLTVSPDQGTSVSQTSFAVQGGVGMQLHLVGLTTSLEAKVVNVFGKQDANFSKGSRTIWPITFGMSF